MISGGGKKSWKFANKNFLFDYKFKFWCISCVNFEYHVALGWNIYVADPNNTNSHRNFFDPLYLVSNRILVLVPSTIWSNLSFWSKNSNLIQIMQYDAKIQFDPKIPIWSKSSIWSKKFNLIKKNQSCFKSQYDSKIPIWSKTLFLIQKFNPSPKIQFDPKFQFDP